MKSSGTATGKATNLVHTVSVGEVTVPVHHLCALHNASQIFHLLSTGTPQGYLFAQAHFPWVGSPLSPGLPWILKRSFQSLQRISMGYGK